GQRGHRRGERRVVGGEDHLAGAAGERALDAAHDEWAAGDQAQGLARQARGGITGGYGDTEAHAGILARPPLCPAAGRRHVQCAAEARAWRVLSMRRRMVAMASAGSRAVTGTAYQPGCAKRRHFTASFSVISTGRPSRNARSAGRKSWWSANACGTTMMPAASSVAKKRAGSPIPATACTLCRAKDASGRAPEPSSASA